MQLNLTNIKTHLHPLTNDVMQVPSSGYGQPSQRGRKRQADCAKPTPAAEARTGAETALNVPAAKDHLPRQMQHPTAAVAGLPPTQVRAALHAFTPLHTMAGLVFCPRLHSSRTLTGQSEQCTPVPAGRMLSLQAPPSSPLWIFILP